MSRRHADPVEVRHRDTPTGPVPEQFLWRGRLHLVREVLSRWTETTAWWQGTQARAITAGDALVPPPASPRWGQRAWGDPAPDLGVAVKPEVGGPGGLREREREVWRVEAGSGRASASSGGMGVFDLSFDPSTGRWSLSRVLD